MSAPDPADSREIAPGVGVMIRTADGTWIGPTRALSSPHLNVKHKFGRSARPDRVTAAEALIDRIFPDPSVPKGER